MHGYRLISKASFLVNVIYILILMDAHQIEPILLLCAWLEEFDLAIAKCPEQTLIPYIAHAVQSELGLSFLQQDRLDHNIVGFRCSTVVVDQTSCLKKIQSC